MKLSLVSLLLCSFYKLTQQSEINPDIRAKIIQESKEPLEFSMDINSGKKILEFSDEQDIFDIQLTPDLTNPDHRDPVGFCEPFPNMAIFSETPGTYTQVYPSYFDEDGNLLDEDHTPPQLIAYHRASRNGIVAIDTDYNLIQVNVKDPTKDRPYHQPEVQKFLNFKEMRPNAQDSDYPYISSIVSANNEVKKTFLFFNNQVIIYDHDTHNFRNTTGWHTVSNIKRLTISYADGIGNLQTKGNPLIFVAVGSNGAYIYQILDDDTLVKIKYINNVFIGKTADFQVDFTDVDHLYQEDSVYFLERNSGIHKINIKTQPDGGLATVTHDKSLPFHFEQGLRVRHFSEYETVQSVILKRQIFIAIIEENGLKYTVEYIKNYELDEWFMNKKEHYPDIDLSDVIVTRNFAVLLGTNVHKIVYHSIVEKYKTDQIEFMNDFSLSFIPGLVDSEFVTDYNHQNVQYYGDEDPDHPKLFLIGISKRHIVYHNVARYYPQLSCWPMYFQPIEDEKPILKEKVYWYDLTYLSRNCLEKDQSGNKYSDYVVCETKRRIAVGLTTTFLNSSAMVWIAVIITFTSVVALSLIIWGYCKYRRTKQDKSYFESEIKTLMKKIKGKKGGGSKKSEQKYAQMNEAEDD